MRISSTVCGREKYRRTLDSRQTGVWVLTATGFQPFDRLLEAKKLLVGGEGTKNDK